MRFTVPAELQAIRWYGLGPDETYPDRRSAATRAVWNSLADDQYHPFALPQEHGAHVDTSWFTITGSEGGLVVQADEPLAFAARRHHDDALTTATTLADLDESQLVEVHVDRAVRGLGTGACGPDTLDSYRVRGGRHRWSWYLGFTRR